MGSDRRTVRRCGRGMAWLTVAALGAWLMVGCGGGGGSSSLNPETNHDSPSGDTSSRQATVSGSFASLGSVSRIYLWNATTNELVTADVTGGTFSATVSDGAVSVLALDASNQPLGLLYQGGSTVFTISDNTTLSGLSLDANTRQLTTTTSLTAATSRQAGRDLDALVDLDTSLIGGGNGVNLDTLLTNGQGDTDGDLVPDLFDLDNNQNGIYDTVEGLIVTAPDIPSSGDPSDRPDLREGGAVVFDNLKLNAEEVLNGDGDLRPHTASHTIAIHLVVPAAVVSSIASVTMSGMPAYASGGTVQNGAGGWTFIDPYPTVGSAWSASGYRIPLATDPGGNANYSIWIQPDGDPVPAFFTFEVNLTSGLTFHLTTRLFFVFNTPPLVTKLQDATSVTTVSHPVTPGDPGTTGNPFTIGAASTTLTITADRPLTTAGGTPIYGMGAQGHIFYLDAAGNQLNVTANITPAQPDTGAPSGLELVLNVPTWLPTTYGGTPVAKYQVDFTVTGTHGDNSAEIFFFTF